MKTRSLRKRLFTNAALVVASVMAISLLIVDVSYVGELQNATREKLRLHIFTLLSIAQMDQGVLYIPPILQNPRFNAVHSGIWALVLDDQKNEIWHSLSIDRPPENMPLNSHTGEWHFDRMQWLGARFITLTYQIAWDINGEQKHYYFMVAEDEAELEGVIKRFRHWLFGGFFLTTLTLLACQYTVLRLTFRPLSELESEIGAMEQGKKATLTGHYPKELMGVTRNLNALIEKEYRQRERYRASMADLAHSLKTSLSIVHAEAANIEKSKLGINGPGKKSVLMEAIHRIDKSIEYQLRRAVISKHTLLSQGTQIDQGLAMVVEALQKIYSEKHLEFISELTGDLRFMGDENDLVEIFGNLLDNAFKHAYTKIGVFVHGGQQGLCLRFEDDGPGFSENNASKIFNRGERLDEKGVGQGIGLAVVEDIVKSYEGHIEAGKSQWGGAMFTIWFSNKESLI